MFGGGEIRTCAGDLVGCVRQNTVLFWSNGRQEDDVNAGSQSN